jgi:retinol dehydrogenase 14
MGWRPCLPPTTWESATRLDFDDLQGERKFNALAAFGASKMCNLLFTYELARRVAGTGVTANAFHPGLMKSNLLNEAAGIVRWLSHLFATSPERAAENLAYVASSPAVAGANGKFFKGRKTISSNAYSNDPNNQRRLWEVSARLAKLESFA